MVRVQLYNFMRSGDVTKSAFRTPHMHDPNCPGGIRYLQGRNPKILEGMVKESNLEWIQKWYFQNCDGDWEHAENIHITNIDWGRVIGVVAGHRDT